MSVDSLRLFAEALQACGQTIQLRVCQVLRSQKSLSTADMGLVLKEGWSSLTLQ
ncbi:MAG: hypothetical protein AAFY26_13645 [Cyanobacteria bacterium J06638_22]